MYTSNSSSTETQVATVNPVSTKVTPDSIIPKASIILMDSTKVIPDSTLPLLMDSNIPRVTTDSTLPLLTDSNLPTAILDTDISRWVVCLADGTVPTSRTTMLTPWK